jgi:hypothetical protein
VAAAAAAAVRRRRVRTQRASDPPRRRRRRLYGWGSIPQGTLQPCRILVTLANVTLICGSHYGLRLLRCL